jgi:KaiC/GvpD/RAD55 family RecA-like ATPase
MTMSDNDADNNPIKTGIARCYWCNIDEKSRAVFEEASISTGDEEKHGVSWLDELLKNGLRPHEDKPLTLLVTGPTGSGKSTLALELCCRLTGSANCSSLFISTQADTGVIINNAGSFGWKDARKYILPFDDEKPGFNTAAVRGCERMEQWENLQAIVDTAFAGLKVQETAPPVLAIDGLDMIKNHAPGEIQAFLASARKSMRPSKLIIFTLSSNAANEARSTWENICDIVIELDYSHLPGCFSRKLEIVKARFQEHVGGPHLLKIYPKFQFPSQDDPEYNKKLRRAHPYREEGGVFIYPSLHYYLSACKRKPPAPGPRYAATLPEQLNDILTSPTDEKGLPAGRCTAFIGSRGCNKSHLGYLHLLHRILNHQEKALVVSLCDDEEMTRQTMEEILSQQFVGYDKLLVELENENKLEILYYPPGYITPEEFIHRMLMSVQRMKADNGKLTVLFNSLDQLGACFPLCAGREIFVPGIVELLSAQRVTSIFVAADEPDQPVKQYGLLSVADLILSFHPADIPLEIYRKALFEAAKKTNREIEFVQKEEIIKKELKDETTKSEIILKVMRFAGGQRSGASGILELVDKKESLRRSFYSTRGLHFAPLHSSWSFEE